MNIANKLSLLNISDSDSPNAVLIEEEDSKQSESKPSCIPITLEKVIFDEAMQKVFFPSLFEKDISYHKVDEMLNDGKDYMNLIKEYNFHTKEKIEQKIPGPYNSNAIQKAVEKLKLFEDTLPKEDFQRAKETTIELLVEILNEGKDIQEENSDKV